jgi:23S rRNA pseudouridine2605 synthase
MKKQESDQGIQINKYISNSGFCSRREADKLVDDARVTINDDIALPTSRVQAGDVVAIDGEKIKSKQRPIYIALNKPVGVTSTTDMSDKTNIIRFMNHPKRIFPVGRLDKDSEGLILLTNDGDLTQKLSHPSHEVKKIYEVKLDKPLGKVDFEKILNGLQLDDGFVRADSLAYTDPKDKATIGIELHSGRNRVVRRMFEFLGYDVRNLDRVMFGNLTKKNVERGKWRYLNEKEIRLLKFMNSSFIKKQKV